MNKGILIAVVAVLAALLVPVTATAAKHEVSGPLTVGGKGFVGGELKMADPSDSRPVKIAGTRGYVGVLDLAGDLRVRCHGRGVATKKETDRGTVYLCKGKRGIAELVGSHFRFRGFAKRFVIHLPDGTAGTLAGRLIRPGGGADRPQRGERPDTPTADDAADTAPADDEPTGDEE